MCVSHLLLGEHVAGTFVFSNLINLGIDAQLVKGAAEEHHIRSQSGNKQFSWRRYKNLIAGSGDVVFLVQTEFHVSVYGFTGCAKIGDGVPNLFSLPPAD